MNNAFAVHRVAINVRFMCVCFFLNFFSASFSSSSSSLWLSVCLSGVWRLVFVWIYCCSCGVRCSWWIVVSVLMRVNHDLIKYLYLLWILWIWIYFYCGAQRTSHSARPCDHASMWKWTSTQVHKTRARCILIIIIIIISIEQCVPVHLCIIAWLPPIK